jgi:DUF1365 family protein
MTPGPAAVCPGTVYHRRGAPSVHEFTYPVSYVWLDPDRPDQLCDAHPWWSAAHPAPARFRRRDYGVRATGSLTDAALDELTPVLGGRPAGPVRMLTQTRRWGWLFNPITVYVVWDDGASEDASEDVATSTTDPVGLVLEVTNTPWKERVRYPVRLGRHGDWLVGATDKRLHVSPFLDEAHRYDIRLRSDDGGLELSIDVVPHGAESPVVRTSLDVERRPADRAALSSALAHPAASTLRVSLGIHVQALRLWLKRVPVVAHPRKREVVS